MKNQVFHKNKYDLKYHFYVMEKFCDLFTFRPSDLITTLTYVLMDKFCPCFYLQFGIRQDNLLPIKVLRKMQNQKG